MINTIISWNITQIEGVDSFKARYIKAILFRVRTSLMMSVNTTLGTEKMLCRHRVELVETQLILAFNNFDPIK